MNWNKKYKIYSKFYKIYFNIYEFNKAIKYKFKKLFNK